MTEIKTEAGWDEPRAWLVEWIRGGETWVDVHADEPRAIDQARKNAGTCVPLYARAPSLLTRIKSERDRA